MLKNLFLLLFTLAVLPAFAQKKQNVYFYKNNGKEVRTQDSADFIRIIQEPDSGAKYYVLIELYPDGTKKRIGSVSQFYPNLYLEASAISYHKNGRKESIINYKYNQIDGAAIYYFPNGRVYKYLEYTDKNPSEKNYGARNGERYWNIKMNYLADSLGHEMVVDGNGHAVDPVIERDSIVSGGDFKNGYKHGVWKGKSLSGYSSYEEEYKEGAFVKGSATVNGLTQTYKSIDQHPSYKGGLESFYRNLQRMLHYTKDAKEKDIQGKVFVSFVVLEDGSLSELKVDRSLHPSLDREALSAIKLCGKWIPGRMHGMPVVVKMNIPISFSLTNAPDRMDDIMQDMDRMGRGSF